MKIEIPLKGVPANIRAQVEAQLPPPLEVAGWKFNGYRWRKLSQINTKDDEGNTDNSVRKGGTGDNEELRSSILANQTELLRISQIEDPFLKYYELMKFNKSIGQRYFNTIPGYAATLSDPSYFRDGTALLFQGDE